MTLHGVVDAPVGQRTSDPERTEAREIQQSLVPTGSLVGGSFEVAYRFYPLLEVGGDFTDFFNLPNGLVGIYVGDVVGKGLSAAMYAALVMGTLRGIHKTDQDTVSVLALLNNRLLVRPVPGRYCAMLYALFNPVTLQLTFSNAGLPRPLLVTEAGCKHLGEGGIPSGLFPNSTYDLHTVQLKAGDAVLFATDGLHELRNHNEEDFSAARLEEIWAECARKPADESLNFLFEGVESFSAGTVLLDDITAVVLNVPACTAE